MEDLKFTIITPSFNQGDFIEATICSVLKQNYKNVEYFVIDGGSTDRSVDVIEKYQHEIIFWITEKDRGQSHALNKGIRRATGDILIWINSDDIMEEGALESAAKYFLANPSVDVIHGRTILFQESAHLIRGADEKYLPEHYLSGMAFPQPSAFIRRSAIEKYHPQLDEALHYGMDYDLFACLYLNCFFLSVSNIFSKYRLHPESKTVNTNEGFAKDWQKVFYNIIHSIGGFEEIKHDLAYLGMEESVELKYPVSKSFEKTFVLKSFQYFLEFQINFYYRDLNLLMVRRISAFLKNRFPSFYKEKNIERLHLISRIPYARYLIPLMRKSAF